MWEKHDRICIAVSICVAMIISCPPILGAVPQEIRCPVVSLYQLGDSISDTGNNIRIVPLVQASRHPYGQSFPGYPTGRWSDGRLIIDYIATAVGLPLLKPYLDKTASFNNGVNFAVAGSTALELSFFLAKGVVVPPLPPLSTVQLSWYTKYLNSINSTSTDNLRNSVVFVGESGYNDLRYPVSQGRSVEDLYSYIPFIVQAIITTTREVIKGGASQVVVPGNFPLGCFPTFLIPLVSKDPTSYDDIGCLKSLNNLITSMNNMLQEALDSLRNEFPTVVILYADYYNAFQSLLRQPSTLGFDTRVLLKPCCGSGRNPLSLTFCGSLGASVCPNPNIYIHWDGIHLTQEAYHHISEILIRDLKIDCTHIKP